MNTSGTAITRREAATLWNSQVDVIVSVIQGRELPYGPMKQSTRLVVLGLNRGGQVWTIIPVGVVESTAATKLAQQAPKHGHTLTACATDIVISATVDLHG